MRAGSQSPSRIARRGSLLRHDITNEVLDERGRGRERREVENTGSEVREENLGKGKGKEVEVTADDVDENNEGLH